MTFGYLLTSILCISGCVLLQAVSAMVSRLGRCFFPLVFYSFISAILTCFVLSNIGVTIGFYLYVTRKHDRGSPLGCGPIFTDSRDLWRGTRMNTKNTMNKSKANTHTRYTPVVLVGPIHQLNRVTRKRLQE
jgi:hypothetical protein